MKAGYRCAWQPSKLIVKAANSLDPIQHVAGHNDKIQLLQLSCEGHVSRDFNAGTAQASKPASTKCKASHVLR